jgi:hypothetical protein
MSFQVFTGGFAQYSRFRWPHNGVRKAAEPAVLKASTLRPPDGPSGLIPSRFLEHS